MRMLMVAWFPSVYRWDKVQSVLIFVHFRRVADMGLLDVGDR